MKTNRAVLTAVVILVVLVTGWWMFRRGGAERIDLLAQYDQAVKKGSGSFAVVDATLAGDTKKAIAAPANGRIIFRVRVPDDGWLKVSLGVKPEAQWGPFRPVQTSNGVTLDFVDSKDVRTQHYAFLVSDEEFDALVRNVYKVLLSRGMRGTLLFSTDPETQALLHRLVPAGV